MKIDNFYKLVFFVAVVTFAGGASGGWRLSVGPAWRSQVKSRISGSWDTTPAAASFTVTYDQNIATHGPWTGAEPNIATVTDPLAPPLTMYAATATRTETTVTPGAATAELGGTDRDSPMGLKSTIGLDVAEFGPVSISFDLRFSAYWGMRSSVACTAGGGTTQVDTFTDYYLFSSGPYPVTAPGAGWAFFFPDTTPYLPYRTPTGSTTTAMPGNYGYARMRGDLYQVGLGPKVTFSALEWLDVYAGVGALCNLIHMDFDLNGISSASTCCRLGFASEVGLTAWLADDIGIYAEAGYELIDEAEAKVGGAKASADFSSFVFSAGLVVGF